MPISTSRACSSPAVSSAPIGVDSRREHRPGVEAGLDRHDVDAGLRVAGEDRPLDRRGAAPARQQREVHVHEAERQRFEQRGRQDLAERDDDAELRAGVAHLVDDLAGALGRRDREPELLGRDLHRARDERRRRDRACGRAG